MIPVQSMKEYSCPPYWQSLVNHIQQPGITLRWVVHQLMRRTNTHYLVTMNHGGTHWLRLQIALYLERLFNLEVSSEDIKRFEIVPPLHRKCYLFRYNRNLEIPRIQQTHAKFMRRYFSGASVILLVRDLRDVLVSYYTTLLERSAPDLSFSDFLRETDLPEGEGYIHTLTRRIDFLNSWSNGRGKVGSLKLVKFEDMRRDSEAELRQIIEFLGLPVQEEALKFALSGSTLSAMSQLEKKRPQDKVKQSTKVRTGSMRKYKDYFSEADREYFQDVVRLRLSDDFGYDYSDW